MRIHEFPPAEIKKAVVGTGGATKQQVQFMVARLLRLRTVPHPTDAADGVAAALAYCLSARILELPQPPSSSSTRRALARALESRL
jgi:crossover junction endodeoxyribonuclease RuvC